MNDGMPDASTTIARLEGRIQGYEVAQAALGDRLDGLHRHVWGQDPSKPGIALRLDRVERLLATMLRIGYLFGGLGLMWKLMELVGQAIAKGTGL